MEITELPEIAGVKLLQLKQFNDPRGCFTETFRKEWFPDINWDKMQSNRSDSKAGVLRGLHFHKNQSDYWTPFQGILRVGLGDLRPGSPTYKNAVTIDMDAADARGIFIPPGVAHGFLAVTDIILIYLVNNYYDSSDEFGVAWNDPELNLPWGTDSPLLSGRDTDNPLIQDLSVSDLPA